MIVLIAQFVYHAGVRDEVLALAREMDEETQSEEGCVHYTHALDVRDGNKLLLSEVWRDGAALQAHFRSAHFRRFQTRAQALGLRSRVMQFEASELGAQEPLYWKTLLMQR